MLMTEISPQKHLTVTKKKKNTYGLLSIVPLFKFIMPQLFFKLYVNTCLLKYVRLFSWKETQKPSDRISL